MFQKTKVLINCMITAYAQSRISLDAAYMCLILSLTPAVYDQDRQKPDRAAIEARWKLEILDIETQILRGRASTGRPSVSIM